jgi:tripartite-type tricarboxylate transporter receptor subunit TctC
MRNRRNAVCLTKDWIFLLLLSLILLVGWIPAAWSDEYPTKTIQFIVPYPPGGSTDLTARVVANHLSKKWGKPISVINKSGGGGTVGVMDALRSKNDGYTMLMHVTSAGTLNPAIESKLPYKWDEPTLIARTNISPLVFIVKADSPWNDLKQVMEDVKKAPGNYKYGTSSVGGPSTFSIGQLVNAAGVDPIKVTRVVLQGGSPVIVAVAGGHVDFASQNLSEVISMLEAKKIKGLAVTTTTRVKQLPNIPTSEEAGYPDYDFIGWNGVAGPSNLPEHVIRKWDQSIRELMEDPTFVKDMETLGAPAAYLGPRDFKNALEKEYKKAVIFATKMGLRK